MGCATFRLKLNNFFGTACGVPPTAPKKLRITISKLPPDRVLPLCFALSLLPSLPHHIPPGAVSRTHTICPSFIVPLLLSNFLPSCTTTLLLILCSAPPTDQTGKLYLGLANTRGS
ncbi:hypothetical protein BDW02DRAFT_242404 [Decorospora gaudefroyi]|uniref:Uncharacterized protein n=1 Tax=Decorospora gaudefroyi TaxID=184978 RepID=A0A6A5KKY7_9PLEO|nr:hypothetical protein BDW02DRAFT_242404 [Decorospora gaudefroyi]